MNEYKWSEYLGSKDSQSRQFVPKKLLGNLHTDVKITVFSHCASTLKVVSPYMYITCQ